MKTFALAILCLFVLLGSAAAADVAAGKTIFSTKCSICHGADGAGKTPMGRTLNIKDLHSPEVQKLSHDELEGIIRNGKNKMPAFKGKLTDPQIDSVVAYIRELGK